MINIVILGAGNVATHLYRVFETSAETTVVQVYNRNSEKLKFFAKKTNTTTDLSALKTADIYIISITDDYISDLSEALPFQNRLVVHTSGSIDITKLSSKNRRGVFYPLQTFSAATTINFLNIPICLETESNTDLSTLKTLAEQISNTVHIIDSKQRKALHIAAVFVNNFTNHLYQKGEEICLENNVDFKLLKPLILETANKIQDLSPKNSQTGPAKRQDKNVIEQHLTFLKTNNQQDIYKLLTNSIQHTHGNKL